MVVKKKPAKKVSKSVKAKAKATEEKENEGGASLDDAFADSEDVEYGKPKPKKAKKAGKEELEDEIDDIEDKFEAPNMPSDYEIKASKSISTLKKGSKLKIDGKEYEVDAHFVLIDHGTTKEMAVEIFDPATDKDYQLRYFHDQVENTLQFYELQEILYVKRAFKKIEW